MSTATYHPVMTQPFRVQSKTSIRPQIEHVRQKFLECYVCNEDFNETDHIPRTLPCLHCVCEVCMESLKTRDSVVCPECNESHPVPNGDVKNFEKDGCRGYLVNYLQVQANETAITCDECTNKRRGTHRCKECSQFLCNDCTDAHMKTKVTKKHEITNVNDLKDCTIEELQAIQRCSVKGHEDQQFQYYCVSNSCDKPVCALCAVQFHSESKGHKLRTLMDVYLETKRTVDILVSEVKHKQLTAEDTLNIVDGIISNLDDVQEKMVEDIEVAFGQCQKKLEERKEEVKNELLNAVSVKKKRLQDQLSSLNFHKGNLDDSNEFATCVSTYATPSEFMNFKDKIIDRLKDMNTRHFDVNPHDNADVQFHQDNMGEDFKHFANNVGKIWSSSLYIPKTNVTMNDIPADVEDVPITIFLYNIDGDPQVEGGVDIRVEIEDPNGKIHRPTVEDFTAKQGCYKVYFMSQKHGKHKATILINGDSINPDGYRFNVIHHGADRQSLTYRSARIPDTPQPRNIVSPTNSDVTIVGRITPRDIMHGDVNCVDISFDSSVAHASMDVSSDEKVMKVKTMKQRHGISFREPEAGHFRNYKGTIATKSFNKPGLFYWEVVIQYKILRLIRQTMLFEMGLSRIDCVDKRYTVDAFPYAWAVSARGCHICGKVCLQTWHNGQLMTHNPLSNRTPTPPTMVVRLHYGFLLDSTKRHWIIVDLKTKKVIFHFKNLVISEMSDPLFPVFAIYNPEQVQASLELLSGMNITGIPEEALDAIVIT
ncbi:TRIM2_3 [Mytilus coruscus]|uniref:TRIM2_3 n=1 Tax=Mytilus coruscus TaxID=42192 RepID=A0A6J8BWH3_MYTCO|nr:TRIM2_3 [Mytilus coruscus]